MSLLGTTIFKHRYTQLVIEDCWGFIFIVITKASLGGNQMNILPSLKHGFSPLHFHVPAACVQLWIPVNEACSRPLHNLKAEVGPRHELENHVEHPFAENRQ